MSPRLSRTAAAELMRALQRDGWFKHHQYGDTKEEALAKAREAIAGYIEALRMDEETPPASPPYEVDAVDVAA